MVAKQVVFDHEARQLIKQGVQKIYNVVRYTLGPAGKTVVVDKSWGAPSITKDGASIAEEVELENPFEDMAAKMIKEAASKTSDSAGDGTTTSVILASSIYQEGLKMVTAGANPMQLIRGIKSAANCIVEEMKKMAEKISVDDTEKLISIARIASGGNKEVGRMLADAFQKVGKDGAISIEEGKSMQTEIKIVEGMQFDRGFLSPHFITNQENVECVLENPYILIYEDKISSAVKLIHLLEKLAKLKGSLLVIAEDVESDALATLVVNKLKGVLQSCAVKAPGYGDRRKAMLEDIAIMTAGKTIFKDLGIDLEKLQIESLGKAQKVIIDSDYTTIIKGASSQKDVQRRCDQIRKEMEATDSDYDKEKLQERLSKLSGGVAQINVGAATEIELKGKKKLVDNSLNAVRSALEDGIVAGGGIAYIRSAIALDKLKATSDEKFGVEIIRRVLQTPLRQIAENSGCDPSIIYKKIKDAKDSFGFDAETRAFCDLKRAGIIDPVKVVCHALLNASSVACMLLTSDTLVSEIKEKKRG